MVVRTFLTRRMPSRPRVRIARSTAPREAPARPALAAEQSNPLTPSVEAFWCHLDQPGDGVDGPGEVPDLVLDQSICDGAIGEAGSVIDLGLREPAPRGLPRGAFLPGERGSEGGVTPGGAP